MGKIITYHESIASKRQPSTRSTSTSGNTPEQVIQDEEGMQVMRELGRNMAWLLKCIEAGRSAGIPDPVKERPVMTNFIR